MYRLVHRILPAALFALIACGDGPTGSNPAEQMILFDRYVGESQQIFAMRADGTGEVQLTRTGSNRCARWSPDGRRIAVVSVRETLSPSAPAEFTSELYVMNADGSDERRITTGANAVPCANWSPDGRRIVYSARYQAAGNRPNLYIVEADGSKLTRLTTSAEWFDMLPAWSPDGRSIAFSSNRGGQVQIRVIDPDGARLRTVPTPCEAGWNPAWSPDGGRFAYECSGEWGVQVHTIRTNGSEDVRVSPARASEGRGYDWNPTWSPDGRKLVIGRRTLERFKLYVVAADGTNPVQLTGGQTSELPSDWR